MRHLRTNIHHIGCVDAVEILSEGFPPPGDAIVQRSAGNIFDALHQRDEFVFATGAHRRETDTAVAHHHGGDAMPATGREGFVPAHLTVVVGVNVDEARRQEIACGVDHPVRVAGSAGAMHDLSDVATVDDKAAGESWGARAVDDACVANDQVVHDSPHRFVSSQVIYAIARQPPACNSQCTRPAASFVAVTMHARRGIPRGRRPFASVVSSTAGSCWKCTR